MATLAAAVRAAMAAGYVTFADPAMPDDPVLLEDFNLTEAHPGYAYEFKDGNIVCLKLSGALHWMHHYRAPCQRKRGEG